MQPRWIVRTAIAVIAGLALALLTLPLWAAPRAQNRQECAYLWDAALVARALALGGVRHEQAAAVMHQVYGVLNAPRDADDERLGEIVRSITNAAQAADTKTASEFAARIGNTCMSRGGDMDSIFGVRL